MKEKKDNAREYAIITMCGVAIIIIAMLIENMMKKYPAITSNVPVMITLTVICVVVAAIITFLLIRLLIMEVKKRRK